MNKPEDGYGVLCDDKLTDDQLIKSAKMIAYMSKMAEMPVSEQVQALKYAMSTFNRNAESLLKHLEAESRNND